MKFSSSDIFCICKIINDYFPLEVIIGELTEITNDQDLDTFPEIQETIYNSTQSLNSDAINELSEYFHSYHINFFLFIKKFVSEEFSETYLEYFQSSDFLKKLNKILIAYEIRIKNYKIQKRVFLLQNSSLEENLLFVDIITPDHVVDYYKESLICLNNETFRSSILFCVFAFEAGLKCMYYTVEKKIPNEPLRRLIDWANNNNLLEKLDEDYDEGYEELIKLKDYRNILVHCSPKEREDISSEIAGNRAVADLNLINQSLNSIFD